MLTNCKIYPPLCLYITLFNKNRSNAKLKYTVYIFDIHIFLIPDGDREIISD